MTEVFLQYVDSDTGAVYATYRCHPTLDFSGLPSVRYERMLVEETRPPLAREHRRYVVPTQGTIDLRRDVVRYADIHDLAHGRTTIADLTHKYRDHLFSPAGLRGA